MEHLFITYEVILEGRIEGASFSKTEKDGSTLTPSRENALKAEVIPE